MSFSFTATGTPRQAIAEVGQQAANTPQVPQPFADAINNQLSALPDGASVTVTCHGHTGWGAAQTAGQISLHATIDVVAEKNPAAAATEEGEAAEAA